MLLSLSKSRIGAEELPRKTRLLRLAVHASAIAIAASASTAVLAAPAPEGPRVVAEGETATLVTGTEFDGGQTNSQVALTLEDEASATGTDITIKGRVVVGDAAVLSLTGGSITARGPEKDALLVGSGAIVTLSGTTITTTGHTTYGLVAAENAASITATDVNITTNGVGSYGVYVSSDGEIHTPPRISLTGGSVLTSNDIGKVTANGDGARADALRAEGVGAKITADGTALTTVGQWSYGAYAYDGGDIELSDLEVKTEGFEAAGLAADYENALIQATNVNVTTSGDLAHAAQAYAGGIILIDGGTFTASGSHNDESVGLGVAGLYAFGGDNGTDNGIIDAKNATVLVTSDNGVGLRAGGFDGLNGTSGSISFDAGSVTVKGLDAAAAQLAYGSSMDITDSTLVSEKGVGVRLIDTADLTLTGTTLEAAGASFSSELRAAGSMQTIILGEDSIAEVNDGTLLNVSRTTDGDNGEVTFTLGAGSKSKGDILDLDDKDGGFLDVLVEEGATWQGIAQGVRDFSSHGLTLTFEDVTDIAGDLTLDGSTATFSAEGGSIGGNLDLANGAKVKGGSLDNLVTVAGNAFSDVDSYFGGNFAIAGDATFAGEFGPGNSLGLITVGGNLTLATTSVYNVEINAAGESDLVEVAGIATLDGAVKVKPLNGFKVDTDYTILTADDLDDTEFASVSLDGNYDFLNVFLTYDEQNAFVHLERNDLTYASLATTPNQRAVASVLDDVSLESALGLRVVGLSEAEFPEVLNQLSGEIHASIRSSLIEDSRHIRNGVLDRLSHAADVEGASLWISGYGSWGDQKGNSNVAKVDRDTRGGMIGFDTGVGAGRFGIVGGYSTSDYDSQRGSADVKNTHLGVYGGTRLGGLGLKIGAAYTWHDIDVSRSVAVGPTSDSLTSSYDANTKQVFGELSALVPVGTGTVEPYGSIAWVELDSDKFAERGGNTGVAGLKQKDDVAFSTLGLRANTASLFGSRVAAHANAGWRHTLSGRTPDVRLAFSTGDGFTTTGTPLSKDAAVLDLGLSVGLGERAVLGVSYGGQIGNRGTDNSVKGYLAFRF